MSKPYNAMSLEELKAERDHWQKQIDNAAGWGAAVGAAHEFLTDCEQWIRIRESEVNGRSNR